MPVPHAVNIHSSGNATPNSQHAFNGDTVTFTSNQGAWRVTFENNSSPLPKTSYSGAKGTSDGGVVNGTAGKTYKYTSCCTPDGGKQSCQDPEIVIDSTA